MIKNYFKIALRHFYRNRIHTVINLSGLALGIASVFLIGLYLQGEFSYDRFHDHPEDLYRITWEDDNPQTRTPHPMAQALASDFPEVMTAVSLTPLWGTGLTREVYSFRNPDNDTRFDETSILAVDTTFFDMFSFPVVRGDAHKTLKQVNGLLISESTARRYFGDTDPIGKQLVVDPDSALLEVGAVFKDVPANSHFHFDFLISYVREKSLEGDDPYYSWADFGHFNYIRLKPGSDAKALEKKLLPWIRKYISVSDERFQSIVSSNFGFRVQPVVDIHLTSHLRWELESNGNVEYVYLLGAAAFLTLLIACVNFMNLTTAKSAERAKEIGIRKSLGAFRRQLTTQFVFESVFISLAALVVAVIIIELTLPFFNKMTGSALETNLGSHLLITLGLGLFVGVASSIYPSLYLSSAKPVVIARGGHAGGMEGGSLRSVLIAFQFAISMALITGSFIIFKQLSFVRHQNLGFNGEGVLVIPVKNRDVSSRFEALRNDLLQVPAVRVVSAASNIPGKQYNQNEISAAAFPESGVAASECGVDFDFFAVMGIELKDGRVFSRDRLSDSSAVIVLNETAARQLNLEAPVGKEILWDREEAQIRGEVIGIVRDFHFQSLREPLRPLLFVLDDEYSFIVIKTELAGIQSTLTAIEKVYRAFDPVFDFEFWFLSDQLQQQYVGEERLATVMAVFSGIAIIIACFGLFGMALLTFYQKIKEISIRKVLGATTTNLVVQLVKGFTLLILGSAVVATPFTWWIMARWLENFRYRIDMEPGTFVLAGVSLLVISWLTLGYLTLKTSRLNPAETLKTE